MTQPFIKAGSFPIMNSKYFGKDVWWNIPFRVVFDNTKTRLNPDMNKKV